MNGKFHPDVRTKSFDRRNWNEIYVVGDVHGCPRELDSLLSNSPISENDLILFVGDLVRKGPDIASVVRRIMESGNMFSVMGNNEWKLVEGTKTLHSLSHESLAWISALPHVITVGSTAVVHGGFNYRANIENHTPEGIMNMRAPDGGGYNGVLWYEKYDGAYRAIGGHTVHNRAYISESAACLDTGCVHGGGLTALRVGDDSIFSASSREYISRNRDHIVTLENGKYFD